MTTRGPAMHILGALHPVQRTVLDQPAPDAAQALLGALLVRELDGAEVVARIVETEAYHQEDPASHSYTGRTARTEPMFWQPGTAYVYRSYGIHWCLNVSADREGIGAAVLLRAAAVLTGEDAVRRRRPAAGIRTTELLSGPGRLTRGLAIDHDQHDRRDLVVGASGLRLMRDAWSPQRGQLQRGPRVGVTRAPDVPWRYFLANHPSVSRYRRSPRADEPRSVAEAKELRRSG